MKNINNYLESPDKQVEILNKSILLDYGDLVSIPETGKILGVSKWFVYELIKKGCLPYIAIGKEYKVLKIDLIKFLLSNQKVGGKANG